MPAASSAGSRMIELKYVDVNAYDLVLVRPSLLAAVLRCRGTELSLNVSADFRVISVTEEYVLEPYAVLQVSDEARAPLQTWL